MIDYLEAAKTYDNTRDSDDTIIELMASRARFDKGARILDFGCGTGNYLAKLSRRYDCEPLGLEPSDAMRDIARTKNPSLRIEKGDHGSIPFDDRSFDFIYMTDVIHHVPDLDLLFERLFSKLKAGGLACVVTESWAQIEGRWYNAYFPSLVANEESRYPDIDRISRQATMAGFSPLAVDEDRHPGPHLVDNNFLETVEDKGYSMFRLLGNAEYEAGLEAMRRDVGRSFLSPKAGASLVWLEKGGA